MKLYNTLEKEVTLKTKNSIHISTKNVEIRDLPYPFDYYCSIASDCDGPNIDKFNNLGKLIRYKFNLPISDSYFVNWFFKKGVKNNVFNDEKFIRNNFDWMSNFYDGWYDVVHGWIQRMLIKITDDFELNENQEKIIDFYAPDQWQYIEEPKYLYFELEMPITNSTLNIEIYHNNKLLNTTTTSDHVEYNFIRSNKVIVNIQKLILKQLNEGINLHDLTYKFCLNSNKGYAKIKNASLLSDTRSDILQQALIFKKFNLQATSFSSHGIGLLFGLGHNVKESSVDKRCLADHKNNPHYTVDIVQEFGIDFMNTFSNTSVLELKNIENLVFMNNLSDGQIIYDFFRYYAIPSEDEIYIKLKKKLKSHEINPSLSDFLGYQVNSLYKNLTKELNGGLIYTHAAVKSNHSNNPKNYSDLDDFFDQETTDALELLSDSYYGLNDKKIFIAPVSTLLRYSQVKQIVNDYSYYDSENNSIYIESWFDSVLNRIVPNPEYNYRELRYVTFYVEDSKSAKVYIDNNEIKALIRNPKDDSGKESVTIVDTESYISIISNNINIDKQYEIYSDNCSIKADNKIYIINDKNAAYFSFELNQTVSFKNYQYLHMSINTSSINLIYKMVITTEKNEKLIFTNNNNIEKEECFINSELDDIYIPFHQLTRGGIIKNKNILSEDISKIEFFIEGEDKGYMEISSLKLLMDSELYSNYCILGGKIINPEVEKVYCKINNKIIKAIIIDNQFLFEEKFSKGSIVEIYAENKSKEKLLPKNAKLFEVGKNFLGFII